MESLIRYTIALNNFRYATLCLTLYLIIKCMQEF
uniref:Uncharacterized protein n=1 Tax=Heterorhabditis bacteriophora TaxID=37862 RepID=A0A1I7WNX2_HETBA